MATDEDPLGKLLGTLMIRNLPSKWSTEAILSVIDNRGFAGAYDFFYMPRRDRYGRSPSFGYAFINFTAPASAQAFREAAENGGLKFRKRKANVVPADIQGVKNLKAYFKDKTVMKSATAPIFAESSSGGGGGQPAMPILDATSSRRKQASEEACRERWCDIVDDFFAE
eukprot:TRINITY_DN10530_c2_g1_i1.p1 TRINITY_DN10530_c2_g1~~TRINITY_DN10530_c2_g1_i1.p1  ORF type:complete len:169 (+),score=40.50 TRINITY_DN10530_c2_g1_i1:173-679(+)